MKDLYVSRGVAFKDRKGKRGDIQGKQFAFWIIFGLGVKQGEKLPQKHFQIAQVNNDGKSIWVLKAGKSMQNQK